MTTSVKFLNYNIASDPDSLEKRKTSGFLPTETDLLRDLGLLDLSKGIMNPVGGITPSEIGAFLNWIAQGQQGDMPPSAKRILCTRLQTLKNQKSLQHGTIPFAQGLVRQLELLIGDCAGIEAISKAVVVTNTKPVATTPSSIATTPFSVADLEKALLPIQTKLMAHIDTKFAAYKSDTAALKEMLKTEIRAQLHAENGLPKIETALESKISALGKQISEMETKIPPTSPSARPRLGSTFLSSPSSQSVQSAQSTPQQNTAYKKMSQRLGNETIRLSSNLSSLGTSIYKGVGTQTRKVGNGVSSIGSSAYNKISSFATRKNKQAPPPPAVSTQKKRWSSTPSPASPASSTPAPVAPQPSPATSAATLPAKKSALSSALGYFTPTKKPLTATAPPATATTTASTPAPSTQPAAKSWFSSLTGTRKNKQLPTTPTPSSSRILMQGNPMLSSTPKQFPKRSPKPSSSPAAAAGAAPRKSPRKTRKHRTRK